MSSEIRPSVQASLYQYLHSNNHFTPHISWALKRKISRFPEDAYIFLSRIHGHRLKHYPKFDVLFNLIDLYENQLGIQKELAKICSINGLKTGLLGLFHKIYFKNIRGFDRLLPLGMLPVSSNVKKSVLDQCGHLYMKMLESDESHFQCPDINKELIRTAIQIEQLAVWNRRLLEATKPRLVILTNAKDPRDAAMQIAFEQADITSMLIPHGFPQKSQHPISANFVMSYASHHDDYLKKLCRYPEQVKSLGWLEPQKTLFGRTDHILKNRQKSEKNTISCSFPSFQVADCTAVYL